MTLEIIVIALMAFFVLLTFVGFPGPIAIALSALVYSAQSDFTSIPWGTLTPFLLVGVFGLFIDQLFTVIGAKRSGASREGIIGALLGLVMVFVVGPIGVFIGPSIGAFLAERYHNKKSSEEAMRAAIGVVIGMLTGTVMKILLAIVMVVWFGFIVF